MENNNIPASGAGLSDTRERTAQDYAIEHAGYMAVDGESLLAAIETLSAAELKQEETGEDDDGTVADARDDVWSATRALRSGIYEFRKRRDRASQQKAAPAGATDLAAQPINPELLAVATEALSRRNESDIGGPAWAARLASPGGAAQAQAGGTLEDEVLDAIGVFAHKQPSDGESWESWYAAAFDMARERVRLAFKECRGRDQASAEPSQKYDDVLVPFVAAMRKELHANSVKGDRPGWLKMDANTALLEVYWHAAKLSAAVKNNDGPAIQEHSADVANMAMMVLDVCGGLAWIDVDVDVDADRAQRSAQQAAAAPSSDKARVLGGLYSAFQQTPAGDVLVAIGNAIQFLQAQQEVPALTLAQELVAIGASAPPGAWDAVAKQEAPALSEIELIEKAALKAGMVNLLNHGAASCVYSEGCNGVTQEHLVAFAREMSVAGLAATPATREVLQQVLDALEDGLDLGRARLAYLKEANWGYPNRYELEEAQVLKIEVAHASLRALIDGGDKE